MVDEIPFDDVSACCAAPGSWLDTSTEDDAPDDAVIATIRIALQNLFQNPALPVRDLMRLMVTSKAVFRALHKAPEWMSLICGYRLVTYPAELSCFRLANRIMTQRKGRGTWATRLFTDRVDEAGAGPAVGRARAKLRPIVVHKTAGDAAGWRLRELTKLLALPTMPTRPQCDDAEESITRLAELGMEPPVVLEALAAAATVAAKPNKTVAAFLLHVLVGRCIGKRTPLANYAAAADEAGARAAYRATIASAADQSAAAAATAAETEEAAGTAASTRSRLPAPLRQAAVAALLAPGGVDGLSCFVLFLGGVSVDDLKKTSGRQKLVTQFPASVRRGVAAALAGWGWLQLHTVFRHDGIFKALFKSLHIARLAVDMGAGSGGGAGAGGGDGDGCSAGGRGDGDSGGNDGGAGTASLDMAKVFLLQALLRGQKYPMNAEAFAAHGAPSRSTSVSVSSRKRTHANSTANGDGMSGDTGAIDGAAASGNGKNGGGGKGGSGSKSTGGGVAGGGWAALITAPLRAMCRDPIFEAPDTAWLADEWQPALAGKKLPRPAVWAPANTLCKYGNGKATWRALFRRGQLTVGQVLFQLRSLMLLDYPADEVEAFIASKSAPGGSPLDFAKILKLHAVLRADFSPEKVAALVAKIGKATERQAEDAVATTENAAVAEAIAGFGGLDVAAAAGGGGNAEEDGPNGFAAAVVVAAVGPQPFRHPPVPGGSDAGADVMDDGEGGGVGGSVSDEVKVKMDDVTFKDKKGQSRTVDIEKNVSVHFDQNVVDAYLGILESLLDSQLEQAAATAVAARAAAAETAAAAAGAATAAGAAPAAVPSPPAPVAVISHSEELACNDVRSGLPPSIPTYSRVSLWRGEGVCLEQLGRGGTLERLLVGIHWCQAPGSERVDLDLSVLVLDGRFATLDQCSFTQLSIPGAVHSGDVVDAPHPRGARETCLLDFPTLLDAYPQASYIVMTVHCYSGIALGSLHDASVWVADPNGVGGSGPGGVDIIAAARLAGEGTVCLAAFVELRDVPLTQEAAAAAVAVPVVNATAGDGADTVPPLPPASTKRRHFCFMDHAVNTQHRTVGESNRMAADILRKVVEARGPSSGLKLGNAAAFAAAALADRVVILAGGAGGGTVITLTREPAERRVHFYKRIKSTLLELPPGVPTADDVSLPLDAAMVGSGDLYYFGGNADPFIAVTRQHKDAAGSVAGLGGDGGGGGLPRRRLVLVNLHADVPDVKRRPPAGDGTQELVEVGGWDILSQLAAL